jgi:hypothetical protein
MAMAMAQNRWNRTVLGSFRLARDIAGFVGEGQSKKVRGGKTRAG